MGCSTSRHMDENTLSESNPGLGKQAPTRHTPISSTKPETQALQSSDTQIAQESPAQPNDNPKSRPVAPETSSPVQSSPAPTKTVTNQKSSSPNDALEPTTTALLQILPKFRILVIGKTGVGKTTLINTTFDVADTGRTSNLTRGYSEIDVELTSRSNDRFILHDSMGFEPGETAHFAKVRTFINDRQTQKLLKDKLHAIWLCVSTPSTGGRIFETGDEDFLKLDLKDESFAVPVIIVFTKYDILVSEVERSAKTEDDDEILREAKERFDEVCGRRLREFMETVQSPHPHVTVSTRYPDTLEQLVQTTQKQIMDKNPGLASAQEMLRPVEAVRLAWAMAQRISPDLKIQASIEIGKQKYWRGIEDIPWDTVEKNLDAIHADIVKVWNFNDPNQCLLSGGVFKQWILEEVKKAHPKGKPSVTQRLMGYIVNSTIIMHRLSGTLAEMSRAMKSASKAVQKDAETAFITQELLEQALKTYYSPAGTGEQVNQDIRAYLGITSSPTLLGTELALDKVISLITTYCRVQG